MKVDLMGALYLLLYETPESKWVDMNVNID